MGDVSTGSTDCSHWAFLLGNLPNEKHDRRHLYDTVQLRSS